MSIPSLLARRASVKPPHPQEALSISASFTKRSSVLYPSGSPQNLSSLFRWLHLSVATTQRGLSSLQELRLPSMWKGAKDDGNNGLAAQEPYPISNEDAPSRSSIRHEEPNERTRLLDRPRPPPNSDGYLDPDDPAVGQAPSLQDYLC